MNASTRASSSSRAAAAVRLSSPIFAGRRTLPRHRPDLRITSLPHPHSQPPRVSARTAPRSAAPRASRASRAPATSTRASRALPSTRATAARRAARAGAARCALRSTRSRQRSRQRLLLPLLPGRSSSRATRASPPPPPSRCSEPATRDPLRPLPDSARPRFPYSCSACPRGRAKRSRPTDTLSKGGAHPSSTFLSFFYRPFLALSITLYRPRCLDVSHPSVPPLSPLALSNFVQPGGGLPLRA